MIYPSVIPFYALLSDLIHRIGDDLQRNVIAHAVTAYDVVWQVGN